MTLRDREGLIARIRQIRRASAAPRRAPISEAETDPSRLGAIEARLAHLERLVEGLQDSVHRESERHGKLIADIQAQIEPGAMSAALTKDARDRGL